MTMCRKAKNLIAATAVAAVLAGSALAQNVPYRHIFAGLTPDLSCRLEMVGSQGSNLARLQAVTADGSMIGPAERYDLSNGKTGRFFTTWLEDRRVSTIIVDADRQIALT